MFIPAAIQSPMLVYVVDVAAARQATRDIARRDAREDTREAAREAARKDGEEALRLSSKRSMEGSVLSSTSLISS
jgi:hypothetical protein